MKDVLISMLGIFVQKTTVYLLAGRGEMEMVGKEWVGQGWKIRRVNRELSEWDLIPGLYSLEADALLEMLFERTFCCSNDK